MHATKEEMKHISPLKKRADFLHLGKSGTRWVSKNFVFQAIPRAEAENLPADHIRFGLTITKRIFKSAVKRNRIKRRLRAICYDVLAAHAKHGCDYVLIGREGALDCAYGLLERDLLWCLRKTEFIRSDD